MKTTIALALIFLCVDAVAASYYSSPDSRPVVCATPETAIEAARLLRAEDHGKDVGRIMKSGHCRIYGAGTRFEILETKEKYSQIKIPGIDSKTPRYISGTESMLNGPFDSLSDNPTYPPGCRDPVGGEVNRWELGQNGQLFLKRYFITERCVNGKMRSFTKKLN